MKRFFISVFLLAAAATAQAKTDSPYLEDYTWPEVKARMEKGTDTIIIPSGGTEQNGPHIAIGKHNWIVRYTSGEIAHELGNALAAPVIAYVPEGHINPPDSHMKFPGTISVRDEGFATVLEDAARSFKAHGFKHICFIGDHGGNQAVQRMVADKLNEEWKGQGVTVLHVSRYYSGNGADEWVAEQKIGVEKPEAHAGFMDASEAMAVNKNAVRRDQMKPYTEKDFPINGAMGDPTKATPEYGKKLLGFKIKAAVEQIRAAFKE